MTIIHITDELMPSAGGLVSVPINLAAAQAALGHDVVLIGRTGKEQLLASNETSNIPNFGKVELVDCEQPGLAAKLFPHRAKKVLMKYITNESIVHLHGVWDPLLLLASKISRSVSATYITTPHSMLHPWQMERFTWQKKVVFAIGWRKMFRGAAFIHALTTAEADYIKAFDFGTPIEIIPNGIYPEALAPPATNSFLQKHPELQGVPYILFLSRLHNQKGITHLLDGFERFASTTPDVRLILAGPDYGETAIIEKRLSHIEHTDRVILLGAIYGDDKLGALHGAYCFALTSLNEGFSVAILEALACGLPVIISKHCYFPEVEKNGAGIISPLDPTSISNALTQIFTNEEQRAMYSENAKRMVQEHYTWRNIGQQTINLYEKYM